MWYVTSQKHGAGTGRFAPLLPKEIAVRFPILYMTDTEVSQPSKTVGALRTVKSVQRKKHDKHQAKEFFCPALLSASMAVPAAAQLNNPQGLALDSHGCPCIADAGDKNLI
jgi:hypothetical protein